MRYLLKKVFLKSPLPFQNQRGMTLAEILLVTALFSVLMGACLMVLLSGSASWQTNSVQVQLQQELRISIEWIKEDLMESGSSVITDVPPDGNWYNTITFKVSNGVSGGNIVWSSQAIQYLLGGADSNQLQRKVGAQVKIIAQNIQALHFRRQVATPNLVEISLTAQKNTTEGRLMTTTVPFEVKLRN